MLMQVFRPAVGAAVFGAAFVLLPLSASAHHGWGGNAAEVTEMTGTVMEEVSLAGPHATMKLYVDGRAWDITLAPPARTSAAGLRQGVIPVGETVTVTGNRNRDANRLEMKTILVTWGEKRFHVYPDRQALLTR